LLLRNRYLTAAVKSPIIWLYVKEVVLKRLLLYFAILVLLIHPALARKKTTDKPPSAAANASKPESSKKIAPQSSAIASRPKPSNEFLQCVAFSPYIGKLSPDYGEQPSKELIGELLDRLVDQTPFRCIMTYGVMNGLEAIFAKAEQKKLKVIAIIWLDKDAEVNSQSIAKGIEVAKAYPKTIIRLSCGSEVRTRHGDKFDGEISRCITALRDAEVKQPITTIDTWWEWCNRSKPCQPTTFTPMVDWVGANIFPWWENKHSVLYPCVPAEKAADFHVARLEEVRNAYPELEVIMTEFGWPNAPEDATETNKITGQKCGVANSANQKMVVRDTFRKLAERKWSSVMFEAFSENWKPSSEGDFGGGWGVCRGVWPYGCTDDILGNASQKTEPINKKLK
jgi:exo-beta-1,3-glucanase (GH17 family)